MLWPEVCYIHSSVMCNPACARAANIKGRGCKAPTYQAAVPEPPCHFQKLGQPSFQVFSHPCTEYFLLLLQAYVITYFATSSSTKSPARIALILGRGNYLLEMTKFGASTLCAALTVLTARMESCAAALLSRKPRVVIEN